MKASTTILIILALLIIGFVVWPRTKADPMTPGTTVTQSDSIEGCYIATIAKDVYTLEIKSQNEQEVTGTLAYKNFEKDSSSGPFVGTYSSSMLVGDYSFSSEGMNSVRQVAFKKVANGFVQGFGPTKTEGNAETLDMANLSYDNSPVFVKTACKS